MKELKISPLLFFMAILVLLQISGCKKTDDSGFVTDVDGNRYGTVTIGTQVWMLANLRTTKYNDGTQVQNVTDDIEWKNLTSGAFCWFLNDVSYKTPHGALYNWYAINTGKLCPVGWRVPTDQDWFTLTYYLGQESVAGGKLKSPSGWLEPNLGATNESGFSAIPGGRRVGFVTNYPDYIGSFDRSKIETDAYWWSSTEFSATDGIHRHVINSSANVSKSHFNKSYGLSVRCIKD